MAHGSPSWWLKRRTRAGIRAFVRRCAADGVIVPPVLDAGCGYRSNRPEVGMEPYVTLDANPDLRPGITADVRAMPIPDRAYRTVLLTEVLEHLCDPLAAMIECRRVLRERGHIVLTVPFWYPIHEKPHQDDWWRFTPRAVLWLLQSAGFRCTHLEACGPRLRPRTICAYAIRYGDGAK